jgi:hypothetical protein
MVGNQGWGAEEKGKWEVGSEDEGRLGGWEVQIWAG